MKTSFFSKAVSIILVISMVITMNFAGIRTVSAADDTTQTKSDTNVTDPSKVVNDDPSNNDPSKVANDDADKYVPDSNLGYVELTDKRNLNTKYFQLSNGMKEAVEYSYPVHYLDNGVYKDINNSLTMAKDNSGNSYYTNQANSFKAVFSNALSNSWSAGITQGKYEMKWKVEGNSNGINAALSSALTKADWGNLNKSDQRHKLPNISSDVKYNNVKKNMDLEYQLIGDKIKENITLNSYDGSNVINQRISLKGLELVQNADGSIVAVDTKDKTKVIFYLQQPYAIDSSSEENFSNDIKVTLENSKDVISTDQTPTDKASSPTAVPSTTATPSSTLAPSPSVAVPSPTATPSPTAAATESAKTDSKDVINSDITPSPSTTGSPTPDNMQTVEATPEESPAPTDSVQPDTSVSPTTTPENSDSPSASDKVSATPTSSESNTITTPDSTTDTASNNVSLFSGATNTYILTYTLDNDYLKNAVYPVVIDPTVTTSLNSSDIKDTYISSNSPTSNFYNYKELKTGYGDTSHLNYSLVQFDNMPTLSAGDMIVYAGFKLEKNTYPSTMTSTVTAHEITSPWQSTNVTWNTQPTFNSNVEDYCTVAPTSNTSYEWDITHIAKKWYMGDARNGLLLKDTSDTTAYKEWYSSDQSVGNVPYAYFVYTNCSGLESNWDCASSTIGRGGTANVNLYNGNLVYSHTDLAMTGDRAPITVTHTFNSTNKNSNFSYEANGLGWTTNFDQFIETKTINGTNYYIYTDADGTKHYFYNNNGAYVDELGKDLALTYDGTTYTVKDKQNNRIYFNVNGFMIGSADKNGNNQYINRDANSMVSRVTDGAGRVVVFGRNGDSTLASITDPSNRVTSFTYTNNRLTRITYPDNHYTTFTYDGNGNISTAVNYDGKTVTMNYSSWAPYRVSSMSESNGSTQGDNVSFSYGFNRTELTDVQGRKTEYQFNDNGNTVCVVYPDGSADYTKYGTSTTSGDMGKITSASKTQKYNNSYISNGNMESNSNWALGGNGGTEAYSTDQKYLGNQSIKLTSSSTSTYQCANQELNLTKGNTYTYSCYIKTDNIADTGERAYLVMWYYDGTGQWTGVASRRVAGTTDWQRLNVTVTIPANATSTYCVAQCIIAFTTGTAWFDCAQLEDGPVVNRYNIVDNSDFNYVTNNMPNNWTAISCDSNDKIVTTSDSTNPINMSDNRFEIIGDPTLRKSINQVINLHGNAGDSFVLGGWAKGRSVPIAGKSSLRFGVAVLFDYVNIADAWSSIMYFSEDSDTWQYACNKVVAMDAYQSVTVRVELNNNMNYADFDGIQLYKDGFDNQYTYDSNGNLTQTVYPDGKTETYTYDSNNNMLTHTDIDGKVSTYTYDSHNNLKTVTTAGQLSSSYNYDSYGNPTDSSVGNSTNYIKTATSYTNGNYINQTTDPFGKHVTNTYDPNKGTLTSVTDPLNNTVNNTYNSNTDQLTNTSLTSGGITVSNGYNYTNDRLTQVSHNAPNNGSVNYNIAYNGLGWNTGTSVGSQSLVSNSLQDRTGRLNAVTYGNGQVLNYSYDAYDRLTGISQGSTTLYSYAYDNSGNIGYMKDYLQNAEYRYTYDTINRVINVTKTDSAGTSTSSYTYNTSDEVSAFNENIYGTAYTTSYTYDNDKKPSTATFGNYSKNITYDSTLGLTTGYSLKNGGTAFYNTSLGYYDGDGTHSTKSGRLQTINNNGETLTYNYDDRGYILSVTKDSNNYSQYRYDALGELTRENYKWGSTSYTMVYAYDVGGNITSKTQYPFVDGDGALGTADWSKAYSYEDSNWKDKLTSYNGNSITYDNIGNPLTYNGSTYTWTQGRELSTISNSTTSASYLYNNDGDRTQKTVNGVTTKYNVVDGDVTWQKTGSNAPIYFIYDSEGKLWGLKYTDGNTYFYVRDSQNDIIKIIDSTGATVVEYTYDAWGKLMSTTGSKASTLGVDNPFRYRGYYYDTESGFYYLSSRYYNPEWGRYINADSDIGETGTLLDHNLYAYCGNNPVVRADENGDFWNIIVGAVIGGLIGGISDAITQVATTGHVDIVKSLRAAAYGAVSGALAATGVGLAVSIAGNAAISMAQNATEQLINNKGKSFDVKSMVVDGAIGGVTGALGGAGMGKSCNLRTLNHQLTKKVVKGVVKGSAETIRKGAKYYVSQTATLYSRYLIRPSVKSGIFSTVVNTGKNIIGW